MNALLNCPVPETSMGVISLGHGSGGEMTNELLDAAVFSLFSNPYLDTRHDGGMIDLQGKIAISTDSFVVSPLFFPGGNIGDLAVNGTINDLAMCGASPRYLSLALILEEGLAISDLEKILLSVRNACAASGVEIITGDTKVVEHGKGDKIFINTTGIGTVHRDARIGTKNIKKGDSLILSGNLATHGITLMSLRRGLEFQTSLTSDTRPLHRMTSSLLDTFGSKIHFMRDPTRGGLATVLNEAARDSGFGIRMAESLLPIHEEVENACELLGLDPLHVANEGIFAAIIDGSVADQCLASIREFGEGKDAAIIGEVIHDPSHRVTMESITGGTRVIRMLPGMQLPRIC